MLVNCHHATSWPGSVLSLTTILLFAHPSSAASLTNADIMGAKPGMTQAQVESLISGSLSGFTYSPKSATFGSVALLLTETFQQQDSGRTDTVIALFSGPPDDTRTVGLTHVVKSSVPGEPIRYGGQPLLLKTMLASLAARYGLTAADASGLEVETAAAGQPLMVVLEQDTGDTSSRKVDWKRDNPEVALARQVTAYYLSIPEISSSGALQAFSGGPTVPAPTASDLEASVAAHRATCDYRLFITIRTVAPSPATKPPPDRAVDGFGITLTAPRLSLKQGLARIKFVDQAEQEAGKPKL